MTSQGQLSVGAPRPAVRALRLQDVPPLENGDRLTRAEFERRYNAMPRIKKAELIEGEVHMPSPVKVTHSQPHAQVMAWLGTYCIATPGIGWYDNTTVRLDADNEVQPDALLRLEPDAGGRSRISSDDYVEGPPELVVEIASSSAAIDLHAKLSVYRRNQVQEYLVWQVYDSRLDWFRLSEGAYEPLSPDEAGAIRSQVFPGLWLAVEALLAGDLAGVLAKLHLGLESPEHATFVKTLAGQT
jgi:Uma2 family endonuclease